MPRKYFAFYFESRTTLSEDYFENGIAMSIEIDLNCIGKIIAGHGDEFNGIRALSIKSIDGDSDVRNRQGDVYPDQYYISVVDILSAEQDIDLMSMIDADNLTYPEILEKALEILEARGVTFENNNYAKKY